MPAPDDVAALLRRVGDLVARTAVTCGPATSAADIAHLMSREGVGSIVVLSDDRPVGIVTDRDLRRKVVGEGRDSKTTPASALMSSPVLSVPPEAFVVDALVIMTRRGIHHLAVTAEGRLVGVISSSDVLRLELPHPVGVSRAIGAATSFDALRRLGPDILQITRRLISASAAALDIGALVAELNDQLVQRVLTLTAEQLAGGGDHAPVPYCWLAFGSEARREQTLKTDQDNGLVYADPPPAEAAAAASYYGRFADVAVHGLMTVGFPACPGNVMASSPALCRPLNGWLENFARWMDHPSPSELLAASIHFDLRPVAGATNLASELSALIERDAPKRRVFLGMLARDVVSRRPRFTLFGGVATRGGKVDVKGAAAMPFVGAARVHALELGLHEVNTVERFRGAGARGLYTPAETTEITEAYEHILRLRLVHQLAQLDQGLAPDNLITPRVLSRADGLLLRDSFRTVNLVQEGLRQRFATDLLT